MIGKFKKLAGVMLVFVLGVCFNQVQAQITRADLPNREGVEVGDIIMHAGLSSSVDFESNIFLSDGGEQYDMIIGVNPFFGVEIPMEENNLSLEYDAKMYDFHRFYEQNHVDHQGQALLELNLTDYEITFSDVYKRFTNRAGSDETGDPQRKTRQLTNKFESSIAAEFDQLTYNVAYVNELSKYLGKNEILYNNINYDDKNSVSNIVNGEVGYKALPKTTFILQPAAGHIKYYSDLVPDSYFYETLLGVKGEWFDDMVIDMRTGLRYQEYDSSPAMHDDNYFGIVGVGSVDYSLTEDDAFKITLKRTIRESTYDGMNYYDTNFAGLDYTHRFSDKISLNPFFTYQYNRYPEETTEDADAVTSKRRDHVYNTGCSLMYNVQEWLSLEAGYEYKNRDSRFHTYYYEDHLTTVKATIGF
jgi:hypothetical protein